MMHCWLKLNEQPKWNLFITKTVAQVTEKETRNPTGPTKELPKKIRRGCQDKKLEEERAKREGVADKMTERLGDILVKKEGAYAKARTSSRHAWPRCLPC